MYRLYLLYVQLRICISKTALSTLPYSWHCRCILKYFYGHFIQKFGNLFDVNCDAVFFLWTSSTIIFSKVCCFNITDPQIILGVADSLNSDFNVCFWISAATFWLEELWKLNRSNAEYHNCIRLLRGITLWGLGAKLKNFFNQ